MQISVSKSNLQKYLDKGWEVVLVLSGRKILIIIEKDEKTNK